MLLLSSLCQQRLEARSVAMQMRGDEAPVHISEATRKKAEAAKSYIENMYKLQHQNIQDRLERCDLTLVCQCTFASKCLWVRDWLSTAETDKICKVWRIWTSRAPQAQCCDWKSSGIQAADSPTTIHSGVVRLPLIGTRPALSTGLHTLRRSGRLQAHSMVPVVCLCQSQASWGACAHQRDCAM